MKNALMLATCLFVGLWLAELHVKPTNFSDMVGLNSENILLSSQREELARASRL